MSDATPPSMDTVAAQRWQRIAACHTPWLHEETGRRMAQRLDWITRTPALWCSWQPLHGGAQAHDSVARRYAQAQCHIIEPQPLAQEAARRRWVQPWWHPARLGRGVSGRVQVRDAAQPGGADLVWANMLLHTHMVPQMLVAQWHQALAVDGILMFSCLGPDTVRELRSLYARIGWPAPGHMLTDMHDWGDMLLHAGFADPVMDMERITLTFPSPERLLAELRELGRNLHPQRFATLRARGWYARLCQELRMHLSVDPDVPQVREGCPADDVRPLALTFEIIYGHAVKPVARVPVSAQSQISLAQMRDMLKNARSAS